MKSDKWTKIDIFTTTAGAEAVGAVLLELGINGFEVADSRDFEDFLERKGSYWDYCDEELMKLRDAETTVTAYVSDNEQGSENLASIRAELNRLKAMDFHREWGRLEYSLSEVMEQDWAYGWKKYYHPVKVGERLVVCPSWESYEPKPGEVVVRLDPGMAFGTGTHESTRLCMRMCEKYVKDGIKVLDLGCGSGILAISALLLGAESALGIDMDEDAVRVADENAALNGVVDKCRFVRGALGGRLDGGYGLIFMNIVADVIIEHIQSVSECLDEGGVVVVSGVIDTREPDVAAALKGAGLDILSRETDGGWVGFAATRKLAD